MPDPTPTFTKKHYEKLAQFIHNTQHDKQRVREAGVAIVDSLADMLEADNIKFNREKWFARLRQLHMED
jgi:hypothetical protein